jgi:hypothetical protein
MLITLFFYHKSSPTFKLWSLSSPLSPYRVLCLTEDGVLRIFSSKTKRIITTSIPFIDTEDIKDCTYSPVTSIQCASGDL